MSSHYFTPGPDAAYYIWISSFPDLSAAVLLYYDYVLTLPREIQFLWPPHNEQGWFTLACFINRYIPIIGVLPIALSYFFPVKTALCEGLHTYHEWFMIVVQIGAGALCLLRVYALYGRSRRILGLLLFIGTGSIVTTLALFFADRNAGGETILVQPTTFGGCAQYTPHVGGRFAAIAWTSTLIFDSVVFSLTLYKAFTIGRGVELLNVIVRDGTMYFSALFLMNLANIMTLLFAPPLLKTCITPYTNVLSTILVNRLVLNLRERAVKQLPTTIETAGKFQAALPLSSLKVAAVDVIRSKSLLGPTRQIDGNADGDMGTATSMSAGEPPGQQLRSMDVVRPV